MTRVIRGSGRLILREGPSWAGAFVSLVMSAFMIVFSLLIASSADRWEISCIKSQVGSAQCQFKTVPIIDLFSPSVSFYSGITGAEPLTEVEENEDEDGDTYYSYRYYIVLLTEGRVLARVEVDNDDRAAWSSGQINRFLNSEGKVDLYAVHPDSEDQVVRALAGAAVPLTVAAVFMLRGLAAATGFRSVEVNNLLRQVIVTEVSLISNTKTFIDFNEIDGIELLESVDSEGDKSYKLELKTQTGDRFFLYQQYGMEEKMESLARELQALTGLRLDKKVIQERASG